jgi:hypothetical protein
LEMRYAGPASGNERPTPFDIAAAVVRECPTRSGGPTMKKKWWIIGFATLAIAGGLAVAIPTLQPPQPGITKANFDRIEDGMTKDEVTAIFGREPHSELPLLDSSGGIICGGNICRWAGEDGANAQVIFINDAAKDARCPGARYWNPSTETITDKLRRWLSLPRK